MKTQIKFILFNFIILGIFGVLLRYLHIHPIPQLTYKFLLEAHSHFAFTGVLLLTAIVAVQSVLKIFDINIQAKLFYLFFLEAYIMLILFSIYGYTAPGIAASTLYLLTTYYLAFHLYKSGKKIEHKSTKTVLNYAVFFLLLSSIAPWCMWPLMALHYAGQPIYYNTVYFYLHFQYNGFFTFIVLLLVVHAVVKQQKIKDEKMLQIGIHLFALATALTYLISNLWCEPNMLIRILTLFGSCIQLVAVYSIFKSLDTSILHTFKQIDQKTIPIFSFILKIGFMLVIALPFISYNAIANRHVIISFMHLTFIGTIWLSYWYFIQKENFTTNRLIKIGMTIFIISFFAQEFILFSTVLTIPFIKNNLDTLLYLCGVFMVLGLIFLFIGIQNCPWKNEIQKNL